MEVKQCRFRTLNFGQTDTGSGREEVFEEGLFMSDESSSFSSVSVTAPSGWRLEHSYAELPQMLHEAVGPTAVKEPRLVVLNKALAAELGLDAEALSGQAGAEVFAGNRLPPGARPIAQAYAGHQYRHFTVLGDGRAILLGEQITPRGGRFDIQLKGPGPTPFSRRGDGRAALGPMLREYIISEAMHALGIPTTRSLAVAATGETVWRQTPLPGAVLTRVAASHIRVGTFQWVAAKRDEAALRALTAYTLRRHFPERAGAENAALALLTGVIERQASLIAQWMLVGFVHGVMNTDNMALSGETIDYGPCAFMDAYDLATVFSSIDRHGRYAYGNQPEIAQWNLTRLAEALLPVLHKTEVDAVELAKGALEEFGPQFHQYLLAGWRRKLGLFNAEVEDLVLIEELLEWMQTTKVDFTNTFAALAVDREAAGNAIAGESIDGFPKTAEKPIVVDATFTEWRARWLERLKRQPESFTESARLRRVSSPAVIPRNHVVEAALAAAELGNLSPMNRLLGVLAKPFEHGNVPVEFREPAPGAEGEERYQTYCGT
jgi:serine/tyrosine/threonine adenylyltransferase